MLNKAGGSGEGHMVRIRKHFYDRTKRISWQTGCERNEKELLKSFTLSTWEMELPSPETGQAMSGADILKGGGRSRVLVLDMLSLRGPLDTHTEMSNRQ